METMRDSLRALSTIALASSLLVGACKKDDPDAEEQGTQASTPPAEDDVVAEPSAADQDQGDLLSWLDPDAVTVVYWRLPRDTDPDVLSVVFAMPPRIERMLRDVTGVDEGLEAILQPDAPRPEEWLGPEALATTSMVSSGTYVVRELERPVSQVKQLLLDAGLRETTTEGYTLLEPTRVFPWKVAFLDEDTVAFIPAKEIGSGLSPLTAARDLPASQMETELRQVTRNDPDAKLMIYAAGPLLHLDISQDILQLMVQARSSQDGGLDVQVMLQPSRDPEQAAQTLESRQTPLENDQVQKLVDRVAYGVDGKSVTGRLELTRDDMVLLREAG